MSYMKNRQRRFWTTLKTILKVGMNIQSIYSAVTKWTMKGSRYCKAMQRLLLNTT